MPTPSEQKALAFVAIVILLGGAVRVLRAGSSTGPTDLEQQAIARQATAADSATSSARAAKQGRRARTIKSTSKRDTFPVIVGGVSSVPPTYARPDRPSARAGYSSANSTPGFPPPDPRVDTDARGLKAMGGMGGRNLVGPVVDMDVASESEIDRLPGIGPTFVKRIVANRDSLGPFGSLEGLRRVKGIGPAMLQKLGPLVTFSGSSRPRQ